jgi:succinate dehydrogenase / fumarate reductase flavoprotein subunit
VPRDGKPWHFLEEWFPNEHAHLSRAAAVRALWKATREMEMGVDGSDAVHIDFSEADPEWLTRNMSRELDFYGRLAGFDPFKEPIKIVPAVYATMGGLWVDAKHATSVAGLFAAGGAAGMYHGASVLAGNELLSKAYGGMIAGESAASFAKNSGRGETPASLLEVAKAREEDENTHIAGRQGEENAHTIARELCEALMPAASAAKENGELSEGREKIAALLERLSRAPLADRKEWENGEVFFMRRLKHKLYLAEAVCAAAIARGESRGAFYKPKFAERDDKKWHTTTRVGFKDKGPKLDHSEKVEILDFKL